MQLLSNRKAMLCGDVSDTPPAACDGLPHADITRHSVPAVSTCRPVLPLRSKVVDGQISAQQHRIFHAVVRPGLRSDLEIIDGDSVNLKRLPPAKCLHLLNHHRYYTSCN